MDAVVDAFVWPFRLLMLTPAKEGELDFVPLLSIPPNCIVNHLVPALAPEERASLALSCTPMSQLLAGSVTQLKFDGYEMCVAAKSPHLLQFSNVRLLHLTVRGWHDIGFSAPRLLLHLSMGLPKLEDVVLLDHSADDEYEPLDTPKSPVGAMASAAGLAAHVAASFLPGGSGAEPHRCDGCGYEVDRPDLSCILISLLALFPRLKRLEIYTKLLSDAEVSAVGRFPELTALTLNSEDGVMPGALCSLSSLTGLRELRLGDVDGNNPADVDTVCNIVSQLTSLHMGYCPRLQPPVLRRLHQLHEAVQAHRQEQAQTETQHRQIEAAGMISKTAQAAVSAVSSVASALVPGLGGTSSQQTPPRSEQLLQEAGVPINFNASSSSSLAGSNMTHSSEAIKPVLEALSSNLPGGNSDTRATVPPPPASRPSDTGTPAVLDAMQHPELLQFSAEQGRRTDIMPGPTNSATSSAAAGGGSSGAGNSTVTSGSNLEGLRIVTELSVNIDAEEGAEILREMSQLWMLESLMVDSTDEFKFDPGFQPFEHTTNLVRLMITMPMSLANTQSLVSCRQLRELLLCTLPQEVLGKGALNQVTRLELLDVAQNPPNETLLQAFPSITHLIIRAGADDATLGTIGHSMGSLVHLELYHLAVGYSRAGLRAIAHLQRLKSLILEVAAPFKAIGSLGGGHSSGLGPGVLATPIGLVGEVGGDLSAAAGSLGVPLLGTNPISAFSPPSGLHWGMLGMLSHTSTSHDWFPQLRDLRVLGYVAASDYDLPALTHLTALTSLHLHLQKSSRGLAGRITLRGLWSLVEQSNKLAEIKLSGAMETLLLVPGRVPGVGL